MTDLYWPRDSTFTDHARSFRARGEGVHNVPDDAVEDYLNHLWERPEDAENIDSEDADSDSESESADIDEEADFVSVAGIGPARAEDLRDAGYELWGDIADADVDTLSQLDSISEDLAEVLLADAQAHVEE